MKKFDIYENSSKEKFSGKNSFYLLSSIEAHDGVQAVKNGFNWPAFFFPLVWCFYTRLYRIAIFVLVLISILELLSASMANEPDSYLVFFIILIPSLLIGIFFGFRGNFFRAKNLIEMGYKKVATVEVKSKKEAIKKFLTNHDMENEIENRFGGSKTVIYAIVFCLLFNLLYYLFFGILGAIFY